MTGIAKEEPEKGKKESGKETSQTGGYEKLTILQIQYLTELENMDRGRGVIGSIAQKCGVKHPTVSRFFKSCIERGYLTENLEFTEKGTKMLRWHQKVLKDVREYLERSGITEGVEEVLRGMVENISYIRLEELVRSHMRIYPGIQMKKEQRQITDVRELIEYGYHEVAVVVVQADGSRRSMAEQGFAHRGMIKKNKRGCYLELTIQEMHAFSRINGKEMTGHLSKLKYLQGDTYRIADIRNGKVRIPLEACVFQKFDHGILRGNLMITVACSVGEAHMPESTARLIFKL